MPLPFHAFGPSHLSALGICAALLISLTILRRNQNPAALWLEHFLAILLLLDWPISALFHWQAGTLSWDNALPFHLCDIAGMAGGIALLTRNRLAAEIVYYFGLAGTLQGLITPNLQIDFPDPRFFVFFLLHGGVVVTALHLVISMNCKPREWSVPRIVAMTLGYAFVIGGINQLLGTNYAFLCHKPEQASLMDALGPWPWYIGSLILLCGLFYSILYAPFFISRRFQRK